MSVFSFLSDLLETAPFGIGTMAAAEHHILLTASASECGPMPPGLDIPDEWGCEQDPGCWKSRPWEPNFLDDPDVETRKCKDIEDFTPEEIQQHKVLEGFGVHTVRPFPGNC